MSAPVFSNAAMHGEGCASSERSRPQVALPQRPSLGPAHDWEDEDAGELILAFLTTALCSSLIHA